MAFYQYFFGGVGERIKIFSRSFIRYRKTVCPHSLDEQKLDDK